MSSGATRVRLAAALLLGAFALLCAHGLLWDTPTVDEFAHLPAGYYYLRTGNFELYRENPPLIRVLSALPLLALDPAPALASGARMSHTAWYPWLFGTDFMERNRSRYDRIFLLGRLPIVGLGLLAGLLVFVWARELYGDEAGLVALCAFAFCPSLVAHSHLATIDAGHAALVLLALYSFHRYLRRPGLLALLACGAAVGLAQLTKDSAAVLYPVLLLAATFELARGKSLALPPRRNAPLPLRRHPAAVFSDPAQGGRAPSPAPGGTESPGTERAVSGRAEETAQGCEGRPGSGARGRLAGSAAALAAIFAVSLMVLDAGYLFHGVGRPVGEFQFQSRLMRGVAARLPAGLPLPLPADYVAGFDILKLIHDRGEFPGYLLGRWLPHGSLAYYPVAVLFKTPLPLLAAWLAALFLGRRAAVGQGGREYLVWLPALALLGVFIFISKVDYGIRYLLPVLPLATIYTGRLVPWVNRQGRRVRIAALALLLCYPLSVLRATPDTISYFNLLAGGRGDRILLDSNLDWGQGLKRLRAYLERAGIERIPLAYFGHVDPAIYGIRWQLPDPRRSGPVAVSANFLHGYPYATYAAGRILPVPGDAFTWISGHRRVADLGGGIYIYDVR